VTIVPEENEYVNQTKTIEVPSYPDLGQQAHEYHLNPRKVPAK